MNKKIEMMKNEWLPQICYDIEKYIHIIEDSENKFKFRIYDDNRYYAIVCHTDTPDGYLGCIMSSRKTRAGEDWTRGSDYPDGKFTIETWEEIKNSIIKRNLEALSDRTYDKKLKFG